MPKGFWFLVSGFAAVLMVACGGDGSSIPAPSGLTYTVPSAFVVNSPIAPLSPSLAGTATSFSVSPVLPAGLALDTTSGVISGTPTQVTAKANYTVTVTNSSGAATDTVSIAVNDVPPTIAYSSAYYSLTEGVSAAVAAPTATGGAVTGWQIVPALPAGTSLSTTDGSISGTPTVASAATQYTVTASNSGGNSMATLTLSVSAGPLVELGHAAAIQLLRYGTPTALSQDTSGRWVLWNFASAEILASGNALSEPVVTIPSPLPVDMAGGTLVDQTFRFMTCDWDGRIRMDCSSPYAMASMIANKDKYDVAFAADTDHDRHGIVTRTSGLLNPNHYLAICIQYLFTNRPGWSEKVGIGKTLVSSSMIDRVAKGLGRPMLEVPVGFKWFVDGLIDGTLGFVGEESAGATFLRRNGQVWTTDKDGLIPGLLAAEMTARTGKDPGVLYGELTEKYGSPVYERIDAAATKEQKAKLGKLSPAQVTAKDLAGEAITSILTEAPGNHAAIGGLKVTTKNGWFAARPSGTEDVYKIYAESFLGEAHLKQIQAEAQALVGAAIA